MLLRPLLLVIMLVRAAAQDDETQVPDPLGLGERLALIDYLQTHGQSTTPGEDINLLRAAYRDLTGTAASAADAYKSARDEAVLVLWRSYNVVAPQHETLAQLQKRLVDLAHRSSQADVDEQSRERADASMAAAAPSAALPGAASPGGPAAQARPAAVLQPGFALPRVQGSAPESSDGQAAIREVARPADMGEIVHAFLISPDASPILLVSLDPGLIEPMRGAMRGWPASVRLAAGITSTVIINCHSSGSYFNAGVLIHPGVVGGDLAAHLRSNREYYETLAGTRERGPIDFMVMTGCNAGNADQEQDLRDGLGYRPIHRVFTAPGYLDICYTLIPAILNAGARPCTSGSPYHASYTTTDTYLSQGTAYHCRCYAVVDADALNVQDNMHPFQVTQWQVSEEPPAPP